MKKIVGYLKAYFQSQHKWVLLCATLFTALAVYCNYHYSLNKKINHLDGLWPFVAWYTLFLLVFSFGYGLQKFFLKSTVFSHRKFVLLLLLAPAIFAWKMAFVFDVTFSNDVFENEYWNAVLYWPFKVVMISGMLLLVHRAFDRDQPFYGVTLKNFSLRPYLIMLLIMVPLVAAASTQKDFLHMYPRMQNIEFLQQPGKGFYKLLYQLSYGSDFFSIELFFRGFLVLAFAKWAGKEAILPMAMFYCTIHFGKPLGECISSYFGGMILGIVSYHTRTILGGFMVHVGIAWLMELGGYLGQQFS
ncbi:MAG TPA: CPBP family intramembrane glutamic endopeptidase [Flavisolibacter sp.]|nr:CPBP family intramembrane glutamic endopeptidase [Flavisolibacter sp.]